MAKAKFTPTMTLAKEAARQHTSLCLFEAIIKIAESSDIESMYQPDVQRIIRAAKAAEQKCLARYDRAIAGLSIKPI